VNDWIVRDSRIFFGVAGAIVVYILYMIIRRRKGERAGSGAREAEL
jgi:hypothetical protein